MEKLRTARGVHDLLPNELHKHNVVINTGLEISEKYNYSQIETPIFEFSEKICLITSSVLSGISPSVLNP